MNLREAWRLSRYPYREVAYRSIESSRGSSSGYGLQGQNLKKRFDRTIGSARTSKIAFAVLGTIGTFFPFLDYVANPTPESLVSGISLSLAISLAYIVFYSLQILPSFASGESYVLLRYLPLSENDFSLVAMLSFLRTFDYIALTTSIVQVGAVAILTRSLVATVMMVGGTLMNLVFAMAIALWFSGIFYRNVTRGGRSMVAKVGRALFLITWGVAAMSIAFLFNFISYVLPYFTSAILGVVTQPLGLILSVMHPFSTGLAITDVVYPALYATPIPPRLVLLVPRFVPPLLSYFSTFGYFGLSFLVARRTFRAVSQSTHGYGLGNAKRQITDFTLKLRKPLLACVLKDLRLASKNPSLAFFYATPLFEVMTLAVVTVQFPTMHASSMIIATVLGSFFTIMICSTLLNTEGAGLEYTLSLPLRGRTIVNAKALIACVTYSPVPIALLLIGLYKQVSSPFTLMIPFVEAMSIVAACVFQIAFFVKPRKIKDESGSSAKRIVQVEGFSIMAGSDVKRLMESFAVCSFILLVPLIAYALIFYLSLSHELSIIVMASICAIELGSVLILVGRAIK
jgi:predicted permease